MNGKFCKDPNLAKVDDFFASGLNISGNAVPKFGIFAKLLDVNTIPGLNTLGISIARGDFEPNQNPGLVVVPSSIFASDPPILDDVLAKGFQLDKKVIEELRKKFS
ncbi:hypothetical protein CQW23_22590 [Capsicum baccatum]|uniref:Uncharacterized protein n=1 Tax=Capsicum baccatum TaxID=33114 RepID=A0A2G2W1A2_CAPBA|nr:hypothetical protein CQW23_22590 [Capsicum baccatum]